MKTDIDTIPKSAKSTLTVSELTYAIKNQMEARFKALSIQGEISNFKAHSSGHSYFDLKDQGAKISCVLFQSRSASLAKRPKEGDQVILKGSLSVYPPHGKYQLVVSSMQFAGIGALLQELEALKKKVKARGWFDPQHKRALPSFPKTIGVVTSPTGSVIRDIIHVLDRRYKGFSLLLNPVHVQGSEAPKEIAEAIEAFNRYALADVLIVGRGGGSLEDLWAFNDEKVLKAIFESRIPIISAVGHETDITLSDFVADKRAPTPSAAAEIVTQEKAHHLHFLEKMKRDAATALRHKISIDKERVFRFLSHPLLSSKESVLFPFHQRLDEQKERLDQTISNELLKKRYALIAKAKEVRALKPSTQITHFKERLLFSQKCLLDTFVHRLNEKKTQLKNITEALAALDPKRVLKRGYSILFAQKEGSVIVSAKTVQEGDEIKALLSDGEVELIVK